MDITYQESIARMRDCLSRAEKSAGLKEPTAMTLATVDRSGRVAARIVLLRQLDDRGFAFFTNRHSDKARQLEATHRAALCFHWEALGEQVRVEGTVELVTDEEADAYWMSRPRDSQIGAWASRQSETLESREMLERRVRDMETRFAGQPVPRPEFWSGYRVVPERIEFWTNRPARLHDRVVYERQSDGPWTKRVLYP